MITEVLGKGQENAKTGREICKRLNLTMREFSQRVERERRNGSPICASTRPPYGFFLAADKGEMQTYCHSLWHRAGEIFKTRKILIDAMQALPERGET